MIIKCIARTFFQRGTKLGLGLHAPTLEYFKDLRKYTVVLVATEIKWALRVYIEQKDTIRFEGAQIHGMQADININ
jgi:hypothetical protein